MSTARNHALRLSTELFVQAERLETWPAFRLV